jgi:hypothetical protein
MAIMRSGPGTRAKKTSTSRKVTSKDVVSKIRDVFSGGSKNLGKAKGPGGLAGVASNKGGVRTTTAVKVTGSKKSGIESLKAKRKSGEMTRKEANTKIKNLRGVAVKPKAKATAFLPAGGMTYEKMMKLPAMDSATFMNTAKGKPATARGFKAVGPSKSRAKEYGMDPKDFALSQMKGMQKKIGATRFKDFRYDPKSGSYVFKAY